MPLTLTLSTLSLTFTQFLNSDYPRVTVGAAELEYSAYGSPIVSGTSYLQKHLWSVSAICSYSQRDILEAIAFESEWRQRNQLDGSILIYDTTAAFKERLPRTRALCPGCVILAIGANWVAYSAQFKGLITTDLKFSTAGTQDSVSFTLAETDLVPA